MESSASSKPPQSRLKGVACDLCTYSVKGRTTLQVDLQVIKLQQCRANMIYEC